MCRTNGVYIYIYMYVFIFFHHIIILTLITINIDYNESSKLPYLWYIFGYGSKPWYFSYPKIDAYWMIPDPSRCGFYQWLINHLLQPGGDKM